MIKCLNISKIWYAFDLYTNAFSYLTHSGADPDELFLQENQAFLGSVILGGLR
jgi:hypothetical protein